MADTHPIDDDESYFPRQPVIQPLRDGSSSSPSSLTSLPAPRPCQHRPPTPPFPRVATPPLRLPATNGKKAVRPALQPKMNHQAYARLLSRLSGEQDRQDNLPRTRSRSNSASDSALGIVLRLLAQETARADAAERELARDTEVLLQRVKESKGENEKVQLDLVRVRQELELYKLQLVVAQNEIDRAQKIVADVERARVATEERGARDRDRTRKLIAERAAEIAKGEGRREGWRQGLERGRWVAWADWEMRRREYEDQEQEQEEQGRPRTPFRRTTTRQSDGGRAGAGEPERMQSTAPTALSQRASNPGSTTAPSRPPEDIAIQQTTNSSVQAPQSPQRLSPQIPPRSPSIATSYRSRRSIPRPTDGYIPTLDADNRIPLPPPFELSEPVEFGTTIGEGANVTTSARPEGVRSGLGRDRGRENQLASMARDDHVHEPVLGPQEPTYDDVFRERVRSRATLAMSTDSTQLSHFDLFSPPQDFNRDRERGRYEADDPQGRATRREVDPSGGMSPTPTTHTRASGHRPTSAMGSIYSMSRGSAIEDHISRPQASNSLRIYSPRVGGGPPLPQESEVAVPNSQYGGRTRRNAGSIIYRAPRSSENHPLQQSYIPTQAPTSGSSVENPNEHRPSTPNNSQSGGRASRTAVSIYAPRIAENHPLQQSRMPTQPSPSGSSGENPDDHQQSTPTRPHPNLERSLSTATVLIISIEPPSRSPTNSSETSTVDRHLLTPDHRPTLSLQSDPTSDSHESQSTTYYPDHGSDVGDPATIIFSDNNLPLGFIPLSPIPSITNFSLGDHEHRGMQGVGGGYPIYAAHAIIPDTTSIRMGMGGGLSSLLFAEPSRPSTAMGSHPTTTTAVGENTTRNFAVSPAPLDRPISLFSED